MKRFNFRLEPVLRVRRIQQEQIRARVILANRDVQLAVRRVDERQQRYDSLERPLGTADLDSHQRTWFGLDAAASAVRHAYHDQLESEARAVEVRCEYVESRRRTEVLERLSDRAHEEWLVEARRDEARTVDDLVVTRHRHQQRNQERNHDRNRPSAGTTAGKHARTDEGSQ